MIEEGKLTVPSRMTNTKEKPVEHETRKKMLIGIIFSSNLLFITSYCSNLYYDAIILLKS